MILNFYNLWDFCTDDSNSPKFSLNFNHTGSDWDTTSSLFADLHRLLKVHLRNIDTYFPEQMLCYNYALKYMYVYILSFLIIYDFFIYETLLIHIKDVV